MRDGIAKSRPMGHSNRPSAVVRLAQGDGGALSGVVERVRSGEKQRFDNVGSLTEIIAGMVEREITTRRRNEPTS